MDSKSETTILSPFLIGGNVCLKTKATEFVREINT